MLRYGNNLMTTAATSAYCVFCGIFFETAHAVRKHHYCHHYEYVLAQHGGNEKHLQNSMNDTFERN